MSRRGRRLRAAGPLLLGAALALAPAEGRSRALDREGTVAILPTLRGGRGPGGDGSGLAPELALAFSYRPEARFEVGIDLGAGVSEREGAGGTWQVVAVPIAVRLGWTPTPDLDWRPVVQGSVGKAFVSVYGPAYREHTPWVVQATAGLQGDLSRRLGLLAEVGWRHARATDPALGRVELGGWIARAGLVFRWEPEPRRW